MKILGRISAILLIVLIVPLFTIAACNYALFQTMINRATYQDAFSNPAIFDDLIPVTLPGILQAAKTSDWDLSDQPVNLTEIVSTLDADTWRSVATDLIPPDWLKLQFEQALDVFLSVSDGDYTVLNKPISLGDIQTRLTGDEAAQAAETIILAAPTCTAEQLTTLNTALSGGDAQLPICNPEDETLRTQSVQFLRDWLTSLANMLPTQDIQASKFYDLNIRLAETIANFFKLDAQLMGLLYLCPAGLAALIVVFAVRSLKSFGRWMGTTSILTGVTILISLVLLQVSVISLIGDILRASDDAERFFGQLFTSIIRAALAQSSGTLLFQATLFLVIGFVLLALSFVVNSGGDELEATGSVIITEDGEIISTASRQRTSRITPMMDDN